MLKRYLIAIAIVSLAMAFATNIFGQNNKRTASKAKVSKGTKGKVQFQDFHFDHRRSKPKKPQNLLPYIEQNNRKKPTQVTGGTIPVYRNRNRGKH